MFEFMSKPLVLKPRKIKEDKDAAEELLCSMTITSRCRYNASIRIKRLGQVSFYTATILSLGLILIPLLQNAGIKLAYPDRVLNMLQIFLAVAVLVYSVVNSTANYETRAEWLNECGDSVKELIRKLRTNMHKKVPIDLDEYNQQYAGITADSENHNRTDYALALIQSPEYYDTMGLPWVWQVVKILISQILSYSIPVGMVLLELLFVLDMLSVTHFLTNVLKPSTLVP